MQQRKLLLQLNVEGISRAKSEVLTRLLEEEDVDIVVLQETHSDSLEDLKKRGIIYGYTIIAAESSRIHGIATYVKNSIVNDAQIVSSTQDDCIYTLTVCVHGVHITNVYKPPTIQWTQSVLQTFPHPAVYLGDLNSHHQEWSYEENDSNGDLVVDWASKNSLHLVFDAKDKKTFYSRAHKKDYNPDLCYVSCDNEGIPIPVTRYVLPVFPNSQHRPILHHIGHEIPIVKSFPRPRWNFQKAD